MNEKVVSGSGSTVSTATWGWDGDLDTETGPPQPGHLLEPTKHHQKLVTGNFSLHSIMKVV